MINAAKKGQLAEDDLKRRLMFVRKYQNLDWGHKLYLDRTGWVHKTKPMKSVRTDRTRTWKKKGESLKRHCTGKGKKRCWSTNGSLHGSYCTQ